MTIALYWPVIAHPFSNYDDDNYVTANAHVKSGLNGHSLAWAFTSTEQSNWHPATWISHELDCQIYGLNPAGHHATNLALHVMNVLLLFLILWFATQAVGRSFLVALLFAVHPLNVESVAWVAERKNLLSTVFFLLAIAAYGFYARKPGTKRYSAVLLMFLLGLAAKPMVITLPCVLLLLDYWPLQRVAGIMPPSSSFPAAQRSWPRLVLEKIPLFLLSAASAAVTIYAQRAGGALNSLTQIPFWVRVENAIWAYLEYFLKLVWPAWLAIFYPHPGNGIAPWKIWLAALFLIGVSGLVWRMRRRYLLVGWCWFLGTLIPVIGVIQVGNQALADRYMYVPMIGLLVMLVWGTSELLRDTELLRGKVGLRVGMGLAGIMVAALLFATHRQLGFWASDSDLWSHALEVTEDNYVAEDNLGEALAGAGRNEEALVRFRDAERLAPEDISSRVNIAGILQSRGDVRQAVGEYAAAIRIAAGNPNHAGNAKPLAAALANLGTLYSVAGNYEKARENYRRAVVINAAALDDLIAKFYQFTASQPEGRKYIWLGEMLEESGRFEEAKHAYEQALRMDPTLEETQAALERLNRRGQ